jgi:aspartyl-tRNA(Asn)/glutamyl-tRNA(Gln) amidotransferase subunit C
MWRIVGSDDWAGPVSSGTVSERISPDDVAKVARLARLDLSDEELAVATTQLADMLEHFADIDELRLDDVEAMTQPYPLVNVLREDVEAPSLDRDEVLAAAPAVEDHRFKVPPIVGLDS